MKLTDYGHNFILSIYYEAPQGNGYLGVWNSIRYKHISINLAEKLILQAAQKLRLEPRLLRDPTWLLYKHDKIVLGFHYEATRYYSKDKLCK